MNARYLKQHQVAEAAFAISQQRPADQAQKELSFSNAERLIKTARLRELRMARNRYKPS